MLTSLLLALAPLCAQTDHLRVPADTAYHDDSTAAVDGEQLALWFGRLAQAGELTLGLSLDVEPGIEMALQLRVAGQARLMTVRGGEGLEEIGFGPFRIDAPGYQRFELTRLPAGQGGAKPKLDALILLGPAAEGAHFNLERRKNAASVHLFYPLDQLQAASAGQATPDLSAGVEAFYCELTADEDPLWSYYMATGWQRGYFGMQVNGPDERRIIFSVWDSGGEAVDRGKVADEDRVQLVDRGAGVVTGSFGNEGTGGHSHLVFDWETGAKQRFLVTAKADDETHTTFAGYYFRPDLGEWMLISSWRAPKEGQLLRGLYSFSENFGGRNGHRLRRARYGNQWVRTTDGSWHELCRASFSFDGTGRANRLDRFMGIDDNQFFLSHGGFVEGQGTYGEVFEREPTGARPDLAPGLELGHWRAVLSSPGGELPFGLELSETGPTSGTDGGSVPRTYAAQIRNGSELIPCGQVELDGDLLTIHLEPYDSRLIARLAPDGRSLAGHWEKVAGPGREARLDLHAQAGIGHRFEAAETRRSSGKWPKTAVEAAQDLSGRWRVQFASDESIAVGIFDANASGAATGTFLTTLGDYRFLAGVFLDGRLRLSCFDGGHAFLFDATMNEQGQLVGDFWSRDSWHETWTATKDPDAELPDSFGLTSWDAAADLGQFSYPDATGTLRSLNDPEFLGQARIISLFGTWCPNCNDEARYLAELDQRYGERGLAILGIAFELDDDLERSGAMVARFQERHGADWPVLITATADKAAASEAVPALDRVRAFPTTLFVDRNNRVRAVHTGFAGPATGAAHEHMRERYEKLIEQLLAEGD